MPRVAVYLNPFDPPTVHHRWVVERLASQFDRVVVVPCGPRKHLPVPDSRPIHRATMADLNFRGFVNVEVDLFDLEQGCFAPPAAVAERVANSDDVWYVVSSEWVRGGAAGSIISREWSRGSEIWHNAGFVILLESGEPLSSANLPPRHETLIHPPHIPSGTVRMMLTQGEATNGQLHEPVEQYILRHALYRDVPLSETITVPPQPPRFELFVDEINPKARHQAEMLTDHVSEDPRMIVSFGGDGTMLRAIRQHWRRRLPFFGVNCGGLGFLLNGREANQFWTQDLLLFQLPLMRVITEFENGQVAETIAFNDAWVERATGQTAWVRVLVNGVERVPRLVGDGVLVSTAAGSSSYARAMGATPVPLNTDVLILAGSNVLKPTFWKPVVLPLDAEIVLEAVDTDRRPLRGFIDGEAFVVNVRRMTIRVSRVAAAELAFTKDQNPVAKLGFVQFPKEND